MIYGFKIKYLEFELAGVNMIFGTYFKGDNFNDYLRSVSGFLSNLSIFIENRL